MISFPQRVRVNVPAGRFLEGRCSVSVRIRPDDDAKAIRAAYGNRLIHFDIGSKALLDPTFMRTLSGERVRILVADMRVFDSSRILDSIDLLEPLFVVAPGAHVVRIVNFLTSMNHRVHIDVSQAVEPLTGLERALDFYLHNPLLTVPIEPFHTLLYTVNRGRGFRLWDIEAENVHTNLYVSEDGQIALSKRWSAAGLHYGSLDDSWDTLANSDLFNRLDAFTRELFQNQSPCVYCAHLNLCGGFLRAVNPAAPCEPWQQVFAILHKESQKSQALQQKIQQMLNPKSVVE